MKRILIIFVTLLSFNCGKMAPQPNFSPTVQIRQPRNQALSEGALKFSVIPKLVQDWWQQGEKKAFETWDENTLYLWGANENNYLIKDPNVSLGGEGLAGPDGPSLGRGHPHYVGVITTSLSKAENDAVFKKLREEQAQGKNIVVPITPEGRFSLGTGLALGWFNNDARAWKQSQYFLLGHIHDLALGASSIEFGPHTFWPDCSQALNCKQIIASSPMAISIKSADDLKRIKNYALAMSKSELIGWTFRPSTRVDVAPEKFYGIAPKPIGTDTAFTAFTLVLVKNADQSFDVLTQTRLYTKNIEAPGGHLTGSQSWQEGAIDELEQETGIFLAKQALIYLEGGNDPSLGVEPKGNANFLVVFAGIKPKTQISDESDSNYGHRWVNLKTIYREAAEEEAKLGRKIDGKYYRFFRSHIINFCKNVVKNLGVCE